METRLTHLRGSIVRWALGFFGALLGFLVLPKAVKFAARRFLFGFIAEVVMIVLAGLITEKAVNMLEQEE